jgi:hypothetical protein
LGLRGQIKMPSYCRIITVCQLCGEPVGNAQEKDGKAYCEYCENELFVRVPVASKMPTHDELIKERKEKDKEIFLKMMSRLYRKLRL